MMNVKDLIQILSFACGKADVVSDSHEEILAYSAPIEYVLENYGDKPVTGVTVKLVIRIP